jgi:hypothetical protein
MNNVLNMKQTNQQIINENILCTKLSPTAVDFTNLLLLQDIKINSNH